MPEVSIADDYAVMRAAGLEFYYGYERTNSEGLWCFTVEHDDEIVFEMSHEELGTSDTFEVTTNLLLGIAKWMEHTHQAMQSQDN